MIRATLLAASLLALGCARQVGIAPVPATPPAPPPTVPASQGAPPCPVIDDSHGVASVQKAVVVAISSDQGEQLWNLFGPQMRAALPLDKTVDFVKGVLGAQGRWLSSERKAGEESPYDGTWLVHAERGDWQLELHVDPEGRITGMYIKSPAPPPPPVARSELPLALPFHGEWTVIWGGDSKQVNHHIEAPSQRRAADLVMTDPSGKSFKTDGKTNADYLAYGQPILAVADGTVITAVNGVPENVPGQMNGYMAPGNVVIVQHGPAVFSAYAHLQPGSLKVKAGGKIKRGAIIGLCGNSGNSSEPHLHFQLQDGPLFERSWGVEAVFPQVQLTRDGKTAPAAGYTFLKGDRVAAP